MRMPARSKYGAKPVVIDGIRFDSTKEGKRYAELKLLERAGEISHLELQPILYIVVNGSQVKGAGNRKLFYRADFAYFDYRQEKRILEDVKGVRTDVYRLKKALIEHIYPAVKIVEI